MDDYYMNIALVEAKKSLKKGNFPVGAVIVKNNKVIAKSHNTKNTKNVSIYHAEVIAIIKACKKLKSWRLNDCAIYVTLEPCPMCMGAIIESRISKVFYLAKSNYYDSFTAMSEKNIKIKLNNDCEYLKLLGDFFIENRK